MDPTLEGLDTRNNYLMLISSSSMNSSQWILSCSEEFPTKESYIQQNPPHGKSNYAKDGMTTLYNELHVFDNHSSIPQCPAIHSPKNLKLNSDSTPKECFSP